MFTEMKMFNIDEYLYDENEAIFYALLNHTKADVEIQKAGINVNNCGCFIKLMKEVFGSKPN